MFQYIFGSEGAYGTPPATKELTNHISNGVPLVVPAPITFVKSVFERASIATRVNEQGLIEVVPPDTLRFDHVTVTLTLKGLLLEEERRNSYLNSSTITQSNFNMVRVAVTDSPGT